MTRPVRSSSLVASVLVLAAAIAVTYRSAPDNGFHFDDHPSILDYAPVQVERLTWNGLTRAFLRPRIAHRQLPSLTFALDWWRGGGDPRAFQTTNLAIHFLCSVLVLLLFRAALARAGPGSTGLPALAGALLWSVHPIQVQAVTYIVQRMASLATLFVLAAVFAYLRARQAARSWPWLLVSVGALALGALSKEIVVVTPALILLAELGVVRQGRSLLRSRWDSLLLVAPVLSLLLLSLAVAFGTFPVKGLLAGYSVRSFTLVERLLTQPRVICFHLGQILWPGRFSVYHEMPVSTSLLSPPTTILALAAIAAWCAFGIWALLRPGSRVTGFFILWVPSCLLVESSFIPLEMVFEHRMYLPSIGLAGLVALGLARLRRRPLPQIAAAVILLVAALLVRIADSRIRVWHDDISLWSNVVAMYPDSSRGYNNLGMELQTRGELDAAIAAYERAAACPDPDVESLHNLGFAYLTAGQRGPGYASLGRYYAAVGNIPAALDNLSRSIDSEPSADALALRGRLLRRQGSLARAFLDFDRALELDPLHLGALLGRGAIQLDWGESNRALQSFERALEVAPDNPEALAGRELALHGWWEPPRRP